MLQEVALESMYVGCTPDSESRAAAEKIQQALALVEEILGVEIMGVEIVGMNGVDR